MTDLADWLLAQIADDEQVARTALRDLVEGGDGTRWVPAVEAVVVTDTSEVIARTNVDDDKVVRHIARWDPARVLAECAAKRKILTEHVTQIRGMDVQINGEWGIEELKDEDTEAYALLRTMATVYDTRPGYLGEWKP